MDVAPVKPTASRTILIVDDETSVRVSLEYVLSSAGYSILVAESGAAAVAVMDDNAIDAALIDVHMPVMNGFDTCLRLKAKAAEHGRNLAVWLMTGACSALVKTRAAEIGAVAVFVKPFDYPAFFSTLDAGLSSSRSAASVAQETWLQNSAHMLCLTRKPYSNDRIHPPFERC